MATHNPELAARTNRAIEACRASPEPVQLMLKGGYLSVTSR